MMLEHQYDLPPPSWLRGKSVLQKCCDMYNSLPYNLRQPLAADVTVEKGYSEFKIGLDKWLESVPDQPGVPGLARHYGPNSIFNQCRARR